MPTPKANRAPVTISPVRPSHAAVRRCGTNDSTRAIGTLMLQMVCRDSTACRIDTFVPGAGRYATPEPTPECRLLRTAHGRQRRLGVSLSR